MTAPEMWMLAGMWLVTFGVRYGSLALFGRVPMPPAWQRVLNYVPVAVLTAIIAPAALLPQGELDFTFNNAHLWASLLAVPVAWRTHSLAWTIAAGMAAFALCRWLAG